MISSKYLGIITVVATIGAAGLGPMRAAAEDASGAGNSDTATTLPRSPLRLSTVDYADDGNGFGTLKLAGIALPGKELYLFLDDKPLTKAVPDESGKWNVESAMKLDEGRHTIRADQYDEATDMLAARAMVSIERAKPGEAPAEASPPEATTP
jgi:hypothetical protein